MGSRDLEKEYDPTQWSQRYTDPKELLASHVEFGNQGEHFEVKIYRKLMSFSCVRFKCPMEIVTQSTAC